MPQPDQGLKAHHAADEAADEAAGCAAEEAVAPDVPFGQALAFWFKLGWISFGGPAGQIALLQQELVERRRWIGQRRFLHALNFCMLLPGPEAQQLATYMGWLLHRTWGGVAAGVLFVLPSLLILIGLSWLYMAQAGHPLVQGVLAGVKPAVVAVVAVAAWRIGRRVLTHPLLWAVAAAAFLGLSVLGVPFPLVLLAAAFTGWVGSHRMPQAFDSAAPHAQGVTLVGIGSAVAWRPAVVILLMWACSLAALALAFGPEGTLVQMGWFFTQAALMTFGGAYAVLPFVVQGAVDHHQWLSAAQMIDGLALGESTPGPLIMVVAFVGFVGGWGQALFGPEHRLLAGAAAAAVVTWFTFLPSFLFILAGAPWVERTRGLRSLAAPLAAITAAVVGVVLNLALFFAQQVLWPPGAHGPDLVSCVVTFAAVLLLVRAGWGVMPVIGVAAVFGVLRSLF